MKKEQRYGPPFDYVGEKFRHAVEAAHANDEVAATWRSSPRQACAMMVCGHYGSNLMFSSASHI